MNGNAKAGITNTAKKETVFTAKNLVLLFYESEYESAVNIDEIEKVGLAYTEAYSESQEKLELHTIQVYADLLNMSIWTEIDGIQYVRTTFTHDKDFLAELCFMSFDNLVSDAVFHIENEM